MPGLILFFLIATLLNFPVFYYFCRKLEIKRYIYIVLTAFGFYIANAVLMTGYVVLTGIKTASFETLLEWVGGSAWIMLVFLPYYTPLIFGVSYILYRYWQKKEAESRE